MFAELHQACVEFGHGLRNDDFNEDVDNGAMPATVEFKCPESLACAAMPQKVQTVPTWVQLQQPGSDFITEQARVHKFLRPLGVVPALLGDEVSSCDEAGISEEDEGGSGIA